MNYSEPVVRPALPKQDGHKPGEADNMSAIAQRRTALAAALFVLLYLLQVVVLMAPPASAAASPTFEIDGNLDGVNDWEGTNAAAFDVEDWPDICGNDPEPNSKIVESTKLDDDPWVIDSGNVLGKGDLCSVWTGFEVLDDGDIVFLFAWLRDTNTGEVNIYLPLEAGPAGRTGDRLIRFEYDSNVKMITVQVLDWLGTGWGNETAITNFATSKISADTKFGEVALNLMEAGILPTNTCESLVATSVVTETGQGNAEPTLFDYVAVGPIEFSSCATIEVIKRTIPEGLSGEFAYDLSGPTAVSGTLSGHGDSDLLTGVIPGIYSLSEQDPAGQGFALESIVCDDVDVTGGTFDVGVNTSHTCIITNSSTVPGAIGVEKSASPTVVTAPSGAVTYTVTVTNESSPSQGVTITEISDDQFGLIWDTGTDSGFDPAATTCDTELGADGRYLAAAGDSFSCTFTATVSGDAGDTHINVVTGSGVDDLGNPVSDTGTASVDVIADQVTVQITTGACYFDGGSFTPVTVVIDPTSGATVELLDGSTVVATFTGSGGSQDLPPGTYSVVVTPAANFDLVGEVPQQITVGDCPPPPPPPPPTTQPPTSTLGDLVWQDIDGDGVQDPGEPGIPGVTVTLYDSNGNVVATQVTDENGNYLFTGLQPGTYTVQFELPDLPNLDNESFTGFKTAFDPALDSDVDLNGRTATIVVGVGANDLTIDAGVINVLISGVTVTAPPPVEAETLPFTGFEAQVLVWVGLMVTAGGLILLSGTARREEDEVAAVYQGMSWRNH
jgi:hypothetical protein